LNAIMTEKTTAIAAKTAARNTTNVAYKLTANEIADAVSAIDAAVVTIKGKKNGVKDSGNMALLQDQLLEFSPSTRQPSLSYPSYRLCQRACPHHPKHMLISTSPAAF